MRRLLTAPLYRCPAAQAPRALVATRGISSDFQLLRYELPADKFGTRLEAFESWLRVSGATFEDLQFGLAEASGWGSQGCCRIASSAIAKGSPVVEMPMACLIRAETAHATVLGDIADESGVDDNEGNLYLTLALLQLWADQQDGLTPFFGPYMDILPRRLQQWPVFWSDSYLELLRGSPLVDAVAVRREEIQRDFAALQASARRHYHRNGGSSANCGLSRASLADFTVAELTVCSRAFLVPGAGKGGRPGHCMVPLADMLNTALPHTCDVDFNAHEGRDGSRVFVMRALRDIPKGAQVHDSYGYKSNGRYLLNYGFSFEKNERWVLLEYFSVA